MTRTDAPFHPLTDRRDFQDMTRSARRWSGSCFSLQSRASVHPDIFRLGLTASRKVGSAVIRNRAKRRLREIVRAQIKAGGPLKGHDLVIVARPATASAPYAQLQAELAQGLWHLGLLAR